MDPYQETFDSWNRVASLYEGKFMDLDIYNETYDFFCRLIHTPNARVLDAGCGPGNISRYLHGKCPGFQLEGIDIAPNMVALALKNNPEGIYRVLDLRSIHTLKGPYDGIICGFGLPYLSDKEVFQFIGDCRKLLSEKGILYLSFVEGHPDSSGFITSRSGDRVYFFYHELDTLAEQLAQSGFTPKQIFKVQFKRSDELTEVHTVMLAEVEKR